MVEKNYDLSPEERKLIAEFLKQEKLVAAVKKVMLKDVSRQVNIEEPLNHWIYGIDRSLDNEKYAALVKMVSQAQSEVYSAFENLKDAVVEPEEDPKTTNESR